MYPQIDGLLYGDPCIYMQVRVAQEHMMAKENEKNSPCSPLAPSMDDQQSPREPSKCHRVCILIISFILVMIAGGLSHSYGIPLVYFVNKNVITPTEGAWAVGLEQFIFHSTGRVLEY